jgi:hypothetical protein
MFLSVLCFLPLHYFSVCYYGVVELWGCHPAMIFSYFLCTHIETYKSEVNFLVGSFYHQWSYSRIILSVQLKPHKWEDCSVASHHGTGQAFAHVSKAWSPVPLRRKVTALSVFHYVWIGVICVLR